MADRIQQRRDTKARWEQFNPILLEGETGYVLDDPNLYKIGDGIHHWNELDYRGYDGTVVQGIGAAQNAVMSQRAICDVIGLNDYDIFSSEKEYNVGDIVIYDGLIYSFVQHHDIGDWIEEHVTPYNLKKDIDSKVSYTRNNAVEVIFPKKKYTFSNRINLGYLSVDNTYRLLVRSEDGASFHVYRELNGTSSIIMGIANSSFGSVIKPDETAFYYMTNVDEGSAEIRLVNYKAKCSEVLSDQIVINNQGLSITDSFSEIGERIPLGYLMGGFKYLLSISKTPSSQNFFIKHVPFDEGLSENAGGIATSVQRWLYVEKDSYYFLETNSVSGEEVTIKLMPENLIKIEEINSILKTNMFGKKISRDFSSDDIIELGYLTPNSSYLLEIRCKNANFFVYKTDYNTTERLFGIGNSQKTINTGSGTEFYYLVCNNEGTGTIYLTPITNTDVEYVTITANSDLNADADFVGNNAIQEAFDSITDSGPRKIYTIEVDGEFIAKNVDDYIVSSYSSRNKVFFEGKNYVNLKGRNRNTCIIRCELPDNIEEIQKIDNSFIKENYGYYQPVFWVWNGEISNITFIAKNIRYPLHIDSSPTSIQNNLELNVKNCKLIHEGKFGDAVGTAGGNTNGFAVSSGMILNLIDCIFLGRNQAPTIHDNINFEYPGTVNYINCVWMNSPDTSDFSLPHIGIECLQTNGISSIMNVRNCSIQEGTGLKFATTSLDTIKGNADCFNFILNIDSAPLAQSNANTKCKSLFIKSKSSGESSQVRVDEKSSAFDAIWGYSEESAYIKLNNNCRQQQYGYQYKDGGGGLNGIAIGRRNVTEELVSGEYKYSLGKRLGDCSSSNKILTVYIDGSKFSIVFDKNYDTTSSSEKPLYTNDDILNEILDVIGEYADVGFFIPDNEWFPNYSKGVCIKKNNDDTCIKSGMGVVLDDNWGVKKAAQSNGRIDGIAIDDAAPGDSLRIITTGELSYDNSRYSILKVESSPSSESITYGTSISISSTAGVFEVSDSCPVIKKGLGNSIIVSHA